MNKNIAVMIFVIMGLVVGLYAETILFFDLKDDVSQKDKTIAMLENDHKDGIGYLKNCEIAVDKCAKSRDRLIEAISIAALKQQTCAVVPSKKQSKPAINSNDAEWGQ